MTFKEFQDRVLAFWADADEIGEFRNHDVSQEYGFRLYYTYQTYPTIQGGAIAYDTKDNPTPWYVENGRGSGCYGETLEAADKAENDSYDQYIRNLQH